MSRRRTWDGNPETAPSYYLTFVRVVAAATRACDELVLVTDQDGDEHVMTRRQYEQGSA